MTRDVLQVNVYGSLLLVVALLAMSSATQIATLASYEDQTNISGVIQNPGDSAHLQRDLTKIHRYIEDKKKSAQCRNVPKPALPTPKDE